MKPVVARAPAKINLALAVGPRAADGFHPVATIFQAVELMDEVRATPVNEPDVELSVTYDGRSERETEEVPLDGTNLAVKAAMLLRKHAGVTSGVRLHLRKAIPVAGGMAGGSADAAAALLACDAAWELGSSRDDLLALAARLGADVPFGLLGGTAMGVGRGDVVSPVLARGSYHWVFALAGSGLPTPEVYAAFDRLVRAPAEPQIPADVMAALRAADPAALGASLRNDLQDATLSLRPELADTLAIGTECGALGSVVSGSGPTVAFLAADEEHALDISLALTGAAVCADVVSARGPVSGAHLT